MGLIEQGVINYLTAGELEKWREIEATIDAIHANPEAFSRRESIQAYVDKYVFLGIAYAEYKIERKRDVWISPNSGAITYADEPDDEDDE